MLEEQEAVRGRLFTIQDVMQSTVRAWLQVQLICFFCISCGNVDLKIGWIADFCLFAG
jgi:hypothetical protein